MEMSCCATRRRRDHLCADLIASSHRKTLPMVDETRGLIRQFETAWKLTNFHLDGLATRSACGAPLIRGCTCIKSLLKS
jgi:hypothetical protein